MGDEDYNDMQIPRTGILLDHVPPTMLPLVRKITICNFSFISVFIFYFSSYLTRQRTFDVHMLIIGILSSLVSITGKLIILVLFITMQNCEASVTSVCLGLQGITLHII